MKTRVCYWYSPQGEFGETVITYWFESVKVIPDGSWVFDPGTESSKEQYGKVVDIYWYPKLYEQYPAEFKTHLLLLGVA